MKKRSKISLIILAGIFTFLTACSALNYFQTQKDPNLRPSSLQSAFDASGYGDFSDYLKQTNQNLKTNKVFMDDRNKRRELDAATPFELKPATHCQNLAEKGILLIHGLADMPIAMLDLAEAFSEQCFLVRTILLPGHGTRSADLISVTRQDWLNATRFGVDTLKQDVDQVYVGGFSLGGLLSVYVATQDPEIKSVFAFSPALGLGSNWQIKQSVWLRYFIDWVDKDKQDDYARYEAMPVNGLAETYLLTRDLKQQLEKKPLKIPIFMAQSTDDPIIDTTINQLYFGKHFTNPASQLIIYQQNPTLLQHSDDKRIHYYNSHLPEQKIVAFSHQAVHVSPDNAHYGVNGDYRNCGINTDRSPDEADHCLTVPTNQLWWGELFNQAAINIPDNAAIARLTFNPHFDDLVSLINRFVENNQ